jgi:ribosomal protein L30E
MLENLSDRLFWDVNPKSLDWEKDIALIVTRVLERGTLEEWKTIVKKYGLNKIVDVAKNIRSMDRLAINFLAQISGTPITEFRCYNSKQSNPPHWIY